MAEAVPDCPAAPGLSEAALAELLDQCEMQFAALEKIQNEITLSEPDFCGDRQEQSVNRLITTEAELKQWKTEEPALLSANSEVLLQAGKEEMLKLCSELEMIVSCCQARRDKLIETKEVERKWLEEKKQVLVAASDLVARLRKEKEELSEHSVLQNTKDKLQKMKQYHESLMEALADVLDKHLPVPQNERISNKKKKNTNVELNEDFISMTDLLEILMNKALKTPHDPYVAIDATFWPPYIEMLLRYGVAVRHQENNAMIRLENFF